jgi:hypothetical protein
MLVSIEPPIGRWRTYMLAISEPPIGRWRNNMLVASEPSRVQLQPRRTTPWRDNNPGATEVLWRDGSDLFFKLYFTHR